MTDNKTPETREPQISCSYCGDVLWHASGDGQPSDIQIHRCEQRTAVEKARKRKRRRLRNRVRRAWQELSAR